MLSPSSLSPSKAGIGFSILSTSAGCSSTEGGEGWKVEEKEVMATTIKYKTYTCTVAIMCPEPPTDTDLSVFLLKKKTTKPTMDRKCRIRIHKTPAPHILMIVLYYRII